MIACLQCPVAGPVRLGRNLRNRPRYNRLRQRGIFVKVFNDHFNRHMRLVHLPAVIVGDHGQRGVGDLRFPRALGLAEIGHANDIITRLVVGNRFGPRAERRPFHVDISAAVMNPRLQSPRGLEQDLAQLPADGIGERDVGHNAAPKKVCSGDFLVRSTN